jgi:hypothetical protein
MWQARPDSTMEAECGPLWFTVHPSAGLGRLCAVPWSSAGWERISVQAFWWRQGRETVSKRRSTGGEEVARLLMAAFRSDVSVRLWKWSHTQQLSISGLDSAGLKFVEGPTSAWVQRSKPRVTTAFNVKTLGACVIV